MAYGSILTIYGVNVNTLNSVHTILNNHNTPFENLDATFFLQVTNAAQANQIRNDLVAHQIIFLFYFVDDPTGDGLAEGGVDNTVFLNIKHLLSV